MSKKEEEKRNEHKSFFTVVGKGFIPSFFLPACPKVILLVGENEWTRKKMNLQCTSFLTLKKEREKMSNWLASVFLDYTFVAVTAFPMLVPFPYFHAEMVF